MSIEMPLKPRLYYESLSGQTTSGSGTTIVEVSQHEDFVAEVFASAVSGGPGTLDVVFEDSADGVNWGDWLAVAQVTNQAQSRRSSAATRPPLPFVRRKQTIAGGGTWTYVVRLFGERKAQ